MPKISVDGAVLRHWRGGTATTIYRDHSGPYLGYSVVIIDGASDPTVLETYACREALALVADLQLQNIIIALDNQGVKDIQVGTGVDCRQNRRISGRGSRTVRLKSMVT